MRKTYEEVKRDFEYIHRLAPGGDMMEIDAAVFELMADPTKARAKKMYESAITQWFEAIGTSELMAGVPVWVWEDERVQAIAEKYGRDHLKP